MSWIAGRIWPWLPSRYKSTHLLGTANAIRINAVAVSRGVMGTVEVGRTPTDLTFCSRDGGRGATKARCCWPCARLVQRNVCQGVKKQQTVRPIAAAIQRAHGGRLERLSPPLLAICDPDHHDPWKVAAPQTSRPSSFQRPPRLPVHQLEALYKQEAPAGDRGMALDPEWMQRCYIFSLHFLAWASQTPPALVQSASVFAFATSAVKAGAVKANASPNATVAQTSFFIGHLLPQTKRLCW